MTISAHRYSAVVKRPGKRDAILRVKSGRIRLDINSAPYVEAALVVAAPRHWSPVTPPSSGHWEPSGETQYPFFDGPPFVISKDSQVWVLDDPIWFNGPVDDPTIPVPEAPDVVQFFSGPPFNITATGSTEQNLPPKEADLEDINPLNSPRVVITVSWVVDGAEVVRDFDLTLRERTVTQSNGDIALTLSSDEGILTDYAPLEDDRTPLGIAESAQAVCNYVLGVVLPGVDLADSAEADWTPVWSATNMLINPTGAVNAVGWQQGIGSSAPTRNAGAGVGGGNGFIQIAHTAATGHVTLAYPDDEQYGASAGRSYALTMYLRSASAMEARLAIVYRDDNLNVLSIHRDAYQPITTSWARFIYWTPTAPVGTSKITPYLEWRSSASGRVLEADHATLSEGEFAPDYFDGNTPDDANYLYEWTDEANTSPSRREAIGAGPSPDALVWRAGVSAMAFIAPLAQAAALRFVCDESREWTLRSEEHVTEGQVKIAYGVNMVEGQDIIGRADDMWYDAAVVKYKWTDGDGIPRERQDSFALVTPHTKARLFEKSAPYPGRGSAEFFVTRAQSRIRQVTARSVADWNAAPEMTASVVLNGATPQAGQVVGVEFDLEHDEMTITTRTG